MRFVTELSPATASYKPLRDGCWPRHRIGTIREVGDHLRAAARLQASEEGARLMVFGVDGEPKAERNRRSGDALQRLAARAYRDALRLGDPRAAAVVIDRALRDGLSPVEIQARVIAPAMHAIGELWECGALTVAHEHLATAVSHQILVRLYPGLVAQTHRRGETIVVAAVHGEDHALGLRMAADVFEGAGYDVRFLGPDVPQESLLAYVAEHQPTVVALGVTMPLNVAAMLRQLQALRDHDPNLRLIVGGQGVPPVLRACEGVVFAEDSVRLAEIANRSASLSPQGDLPSGRGCEGVGFLQLPRCSLAPADGLAASFVQTTEAAADAARGHARRAAALEQIAFRDPLTGLWNRRALDDHYQSITDDPSASLPTILMIDIDRFKSINDRLGHDAGDRTLIEVAGCITDAMRPSDFAARHGGDEFVVLLPGTPHGVAAEIGERLRAQVEADLTGPPVTVSIGISVPDHTDRRRATIDADLALYQAKQNGRNQVAFA